MTMIIDGTNGGFFPSWTTGTRPASPAVGQMGYNTTTGQFDAYTSNGWTSVTTNKTTGQVVQVVQSVYTGTFSTSATSYQDIGLSASITPLSNTNKILVLMDVYVSATNAGFAGYVTTLRGSTNLIAANGSRTPSAISLEGSVAGGVIYQGLKASLVYLDSPATTSSTTYKVQAMTNTGAGTFYINRDAADANNFQYPAAQSTLTLLEVAA